MVRNIARRLIKSLLHAVGADIVRFENSPRETLLGLRQVGASINWALATRDMNLIGQPIAVIGLGYVGLPLAVEFGKRYPVTGFDIKPERIAELQAGRDSTLEVPPEELAAATQLRFTSDPAALRNCRVFIVTVPTPVDGVNRPDFTPLIRASQTVGAALKRGDVVIYESTVYPGATEEICVPVLEQHSGLKFNIDFYCGYSPERINPGDKAHRLTAIKKVTSGSTPDAADAIDALYASIITAGTHKASSIRVAEAAKVIENTQRDLNIALMNELAVLFNRLGLDTADVLEAAGTKWNFLPFRPGLVGATAWGGPLLPHAQGTGGRLPPRSHLGGTPHQRRHGAVRGQSSHQTHDPTRH
jgi:UDP-N-acetyl-D-galactosamine dehydrogenase